MSPPRQSFVHSESLSWPSQSDAGTPILFCKIELRRLSGNIMNRYGRRFLAFGLLTSTIALAAGADRLPLMSERFHQSRADENASDHQGIRSWNKVLLDLSIPGFQPTEGGYFTECNYLNALTTLQKLKEDRVPPGYLALWAGNQARVFAACDGSPKTSPPPAAPEGPGLPKRARSDHLYQLGSWHFYRGEYEMALETYLQVEKIRSAPMRPTAAYMTIRSLTYLGQGEAAYDKISRVIADPSLKEVHGIASNYRFVIMSPTTYREAPLITEELATRHLKWLLEVIRIDPAKVTADPARAKADYDDALSQLDVYFPIRDRKTGTVDWWLKDGEEDSHRMQAVRKLAGSIEMVDWMQAKWAYNAFNDDWLWALHANQDPYWDQNAHIVEHEVAQLKKSGNGAWLQLAIGRVHPSDPMASVLVRKAEPYLTRPWKSETLEYREWLGDLWANSIRISLGQGKIDQALALIVDRPEMGSLFDNLTYEYRYYMRQQRESYDGTLEKALRWLTYTGQTESARTLLNEIQKVRGTRYFTEWRTLLAVTVEEALAAGLEGEHYGTHGASNVFWREMLNTASSKFLDRLAADARLAQADRALISRTLLARAILLDARPADMNHAAVVAAKHNPSLRDDILAATSGHQKLRYVEFLLKHPRFRPAVMLEYGPDKHNSKAEDNIDAIDTYNHNDNNWWCRFDQGAFSERAFRAMKISPNRSPVLSTESESDLYVNHQLALIKDHPYQNLIDEDEIMALEAIPAAPEYLSSYLNQRERETPAATTEDDRNRRAASLHRAVRTTRYGCNRDGSHARYSQESFRLLHARYGDTPWAKATPYWFR